MRLLVAGFACLVFACGCGKNESTPGSGGSSPGSSASKYGTPEDTAKAFFAACAAGDWKALGECCSKDPGIAEIRDGKLSEKEKENFKKLLGVAKVGAAKKAADGKTASVKFTAPDRDGKEQEATLQMTLEGSDWKVLDLKE